MRRFQRRLEDRQERERLVDQALAIVNRAVHASAVARVDPNISERGRSDPLAIRCGHGFGDELAASRFTQAREESPDRTSKRRAAAATGQERLAALLGGHEKPDAAESLVLRTRLDIDAGRTREAGIAMAAAAKMLTAPRDPSRHASAGDADAEQQQDLHSLRAVVEQITDIAAQAISDAPTQAQLDTIRSACESAERILRRRRIRRG